jgi:ArsR family transcriptional regulator
MTELPEYTADCAALLKLLSDETRLAVVELLLEGPKHVGEMNELLHVEQSLLSHHLRSLRDGGIVTSRRDGKAVLYCLSPRFRCTKSPKAIDLGCCKISFE